MLHDATLRAVALSARGCPPKHMCTAVYRIMNKMIIKYTTFNVLYTQRNRWLKESFFWPTYVRYFSILFLNEHTATIKKDGGSCISLYITQCDYYQRNVLYIEINV